MVDENVSLVISRQFLTDVEDHLSKLPDEVSKMMSHFILDKLQSRVVSFEEQVASIRLHLADIYEKEECWGEAANVLAGIPLEISQQHYSVDYKFKSYLKICHLYLKDGDTIQAEAFINKASLLNAESKDKKLQIYYKVCYARVLDHSGKFIEAAEWYMEVSYCSCIRFDHNIKLLKNATVCTILASAGQRRKQMLATLFKDERCQQLPVYAIVEKMYLDRIIRSQELQELVDMLQSHQKASTSDGLTLLELAVVEHNLHCVSRLYKVITFELLGCILETSPLKARDVALKMIESGSLIGCVNQTDSTVQFRSSFQHGVQQISEEKETTGTADPGEEKIVSAKTDPSYPAIQEMIHALSDLDITQGEVDNISVKLVPEVTLIQVDSKNPIRNVTQEDIEAAAKLKCKEVDACMSIAEEELKNARYEKSVLKKCNDLYKLAYSIHVKRMERMEIPDYLVSIPQFEKSVQKSLSDIQLAEQLFEEAKADGGVERKHYEDTIESFKAGARLKHKRTFLMPHQN